MPKPYKNFASLHFPDNLITWQWLKTSELFINFNFYAKFSPFQQGWRVLAPWKNTFSWFWSYMIRVWFRIINFLLTRQLLRIEPTSAFFRTTLMIANPGRQRERNLFLPSSVSSGSAPPVSCAGSRQRISPSLKTDVRGRRARERGDKNTIHKVANWRLGKKENYSQRNRCYFHVKRCCHELHV